MRQAAVAPTEGSRGVLGTARTCVNRLPSQNDPWIARLTAEGLERDRAIAELSRLLVRGLAKSLSYRYGGGVAVEDVVQDAMLRILASLDQFAGRSRFTTWAMTIATRIGISELRRKHYRDVPLESAPLGGGLRIDVPTTGGGAAGEDLDRQRVLEVLRRLIETALTERQREATQGVLEGLSVEEIARRTGSIGTRSINWSMTHGCGCGMAWSHPGFRRATSKPFSPEKRSGDVPVRRTDFRPR